MIMIKDIAVVDLIEMTINYMTDHRTIWLKIMMMVNYIEAMTIELRC